MSVRPITDTLRQLDGGAFLDIASTELAHLVRQVDETGKSGSLTIKLELKRHRQGAINILPSVVAKVPQVKADPTLLWATVEGNLTPDNPNQQKLDLRQVDPTTGEIRVINPAPVELRTAP
jgi:hypothetical protein